MRQGFLDFVHETDDIDRDSSDSLDDRVPDSNSADPRWWLFGDNQSSIALAQSSVTQKRSKHMSVRLHTVRDKSKHLCYVPTDLNKADGLTKGVGLKTLLNIYSTSIEKDEEFDTDEADDFAESAVVHLAWCCSSSFDSAWRNT